MKSVKITKTAPSEIVKMVWHAVAKAAPDHLKADVGKAKDIVFDALKKKRRAYGGITINHYRSLLHLPHSFTKPKKPYNLSSSSDATSSSEQQLVPLDACTSCNNNDDDSSNPVSTFILKRFNEDAPNLDEEIDRLADDFIASFHENFRLEKQRSFRQYQEMLARST